jgi:outer membrane lipopolysaccharide assembly protein LptE/RlpB
LLLKTRTIYEALGLMLVVLTAAGCGYHLRGTGSFLPPSIKTMSIPVFRNLTTRYELDIKLTRAVIDEMVARGKVVIAADPEKADAVLEAEVVSFSATPVAFTGQTQADRYTITVKAKILLKERAADRTIFSNPLFVYIEEYEVPPGRDFESVQTEAIDRVAEKFARSLVATILEGF